MLVFQFLDTWDIQPYYGNASDMLKHARTAELLKRDYRILDNEGKLIGMRLF